MPEDTTSVLHESVLVTPEETLSFNRASIDVSEGSPAVRFSIKRAYAQTFGSTLAIRGFGVISGLLAARLLGPEGRGELAVITFLPLVLVRVGELELPRALAYEISRVGRATAQLVSSGWLLAVGLGCLQMAVCAVAVPFVLPSDKAHLLSAARWFTFYLPAFFLFTCLSGVDQGRGRFGRFSFLQAVPGFVYLVVIVGLYFAGMISPRLCAAGVLLGAIAAAGIRLSFEWPTIRNVTPDNNTVSALLVRSFSFYLPALAALALSRADMLLLVRFVPVREVGFYVAAQAVAFGQIGSVDPFVQVGFSAIAAECSETKALQMLTRQFRLAVVAVVGIAVITGMVASPIITFAFGRQFSGAITTSYVLILATVFAGLSQLLDQGLRAANHPRIGIASNLAGLTLLLTLGIPAIIQFGIVGLGAALLLAQLGNVAILIGFCVFRLGLSPVMFWSFNSYTFRELAGVVQVVLARFCTANERRTHAEELK